MLKKVFCSIILLFTTVVLLYADPFSFKASVDKNIVPLNEYFMYSITGSGDGKNLPKFQVSDMPEFMVRGVSIFENTSMSSDGKVIARVANKIHNYTLGSKRIGKFTIPPAKATLNGKTYLTESIEVEVIPAKNVNSQNVQNTPSQNNHKSTPNPCTKASVNKKTVYENEKPVYKPSFYTNRMHRNKFKKLKSFNFVNFHKLMDEAKTDSANDSFDTALSKIYQALIEIINIKTGMLSDNLQESQIFDNLTKSGVDNETIFKILKVLERINFYRFTLVDIDKDSLNALIDEVNAVFINLKK